jgi:hypothetical protein
MTDLDLAAQFIAGHARLLERRRFALLHGDGRPEDVLTALKAYKNPDGGIGFLEPDLRTPASQPSSVLYAMEILHELDTTGDDLAADALDWLQTQTHADGGVAFALGTARGWPHAPWWGDPSDDEPSSLLMTAGLAAMTRRVAPDHPWLAPAEAFVWEHLQTADSPYTLRYVLDFLDASPDRDRADQALDVLADRVPEDGLLRVGAGIEGEVLRPLEIVPRPDHAARRLYADDLIERELDALADGQADDGGWTFSWSAWNPAAELEWRGVVTIQALHTLVAYGRLELRTTPTRG